MAPMEITPMAPTPPMELSLNRLPRTLVALAAALPLALAACNPTCQTTCRRFYDPIECDAAPRGLTSEEAIEQCITVCQNSLQVTGSAVDPLDRRFNPDFISPLNQSSTLSNEREAAAWMDCVWSFDDDSCKTRLADQYCAKIF